MAPRCGRRCFCAVYFTLRSALGLSSLKDSPEAGAAHGAERGGSSGAGTSTPWLLGMPRQAAAFQEFTPLLPPQRLPSFLFAFFFFFLRRLSRFVTSGVGSTSTRFLVPCSYAEPGYPQVAILLFEERAGYLQMFF